MVVEVDWPQVVILLVGSGAFITALRSAYHVGKARESLTALNTDVKELSERQEEHSDWLHQLDKQSVRLSTLLEMSKAAANSRGFADHGSDYRISIEGLRSMMELHGYVPNPEMRAAFVEMVEDPMLPKEDVDLWSLIEGKFGMQALLQESARFGAQPLETPGIWVMCIRKAQEMGAENLLRAIGVIRG